MFVIARILLLGVTGVSSPQEVVEVEQILVLDGVIFAEERTDSVALIRRIGDSRGQRLRVGQIYGDYELVKVLKTAVLLRNSLGESLRLQLGGNTIRVSAHNEKTEIPSTSFVSNNKSGHTARYRFSHSEHGRRLASEISTILKETIISPRVETGRGTGLELSGIPDDTLLLEMGVSPGDVITAVNGEPVRTSDSLWKFFSLFGDRGSLSITVERAGIVLHMAYTITD